MLSLSVSIPSDDAGFGVDVNRRLLKSKLNNGSVGMMFVGDSITNPYVSGRISQSIIKRWPVPTCGAMAGFLAQGDSGWPLSNFPPPTGATVAQITGPSGQGLRPGDPFLDGSTGHNLLRTVPWRFLAEYTNFGVTFQTQFYPANAFNVDWDSGQNMINRLIFRANANAPAQHRINGRVRGTAVENGNTQFNQQTNPGTLRSVSVSFARGTGANTSIGMGQTWNETELLDWRNDYVAFSTELATRPTGSIFWAYAGEGGYTSLTHTAAGQTINLGDGAYTAFYSDAALDIHLQTFNINTFFLYLGQNIASNETGGAGGIGSYRANVEAIIARYKAACARVGILNPTFILVSLYPTSDDNSRSIAIANALRQIAIADTSCEFIDLRKFVVDTYGNYSTWQASFAPDTIHPNATFSNIIADYIWSRL